MNKFYMTICILVTTLGVANAQKNLFDAADIDANGWIWFDTQAKIDKYIGQANNEFAKYNESGKLIQMASANFGDYIDTEVSPDFTGAGTDGVLGSAGAHTGAIKLAAASANSTANGGGFIVKMPSCTSFSICLSADSKMFVRLLGTTQADKIIGDYAIVSAKYTTVFKPLSSAGIYTWTGMEQLNTGFEPLFTWTSNSTMYAYIQNVTKNNLYIHGIKVLTAATADIDDITGSTVRFDGKRILLPETGTINLYNTQGLLVREATTNELSVAGLPSGIYIARAIVAGSQAISKKIIIH